MKIADNDQHGGGGNEESFPKAQRRAGAVAKLPSSKIGSLHTRHELLCHRENWPRIGPMLQCLHRPSKQCRLQTQQGSQAALTSFATRTLLANDTRWRFKARVADQAQ
jgi:hypothetical protein